MKKKLTLVLVLILFLHVGLVSATASPLEQKAGDTLRGLGIYSGYEDGTLRLGNSITRAEFTTLAVKIVGLSHQHESRMGKTPFSDVPSDFWGSGYINIAVDESLMSGYPNQTFRPEGNITYAETLSVLVSLLGYKDDAVKLGQWPENYLQQAEGLNLTKNISHDANHVVTRGDVAVLIHNALSVQLKK
ncbi:S-layer domain protein [Alkaliphilus metalliredigens QYMF]|uniref:S-layer domain protein n=1 Tax=Alkaliphilus metalliredigens (strain QYMF) TaxID=293826 RepID=A6TJP7_ALKMQ|nr:S-layer homology domain-containing protein [Alkaliphilus metalliredigens]ABR46415.1 S-layer domain protein [Alkaliphilus metalliredigens QYMF]